MLSRQVRGIAIAATLVLGAQVTFVSTAGAQASDVVAKYDKDQDRTLDLNETKAAAAAHFDKLNKDADTTLETQEVKGTIGPKAFKAADTDHDGTISKDEYLALVEKLFNRVDTNHDGTLSATELKTKIPACRHLSNQGLRTNEDPACRLCHT
jgi:Ca2+-binding EF-hand superfamily protein